MCGIIVSKGKLDKKNYKFVENRGPDKTNEIEINGYHFVHFLLSLTGESTPQPIVDDNIVLIFNGEIYNYKDILPEAKSDGYSIIEAYKKFGEEFIKQLDGEFAIVLFDFDKNKLILSSDIFKTKPLFYFFDEKDFIISSYSSTITCMKKKPISLRHNQTLIFNLENLELLDEKKVFEFDLKQYKEDYTDFNDKLEKAILKRYPEKNKPVVSLSSGLDSGIICCVLDKFNKDFTAITIPKNENPRVVEMRKNKLKDKMKIIHLTNEDKKNYDKKLISGCEIFYWDWMFHPKVNSITNCIRSKIGALLGKSKIIEEAKKENIRVLYSGIGADEVMSIGKYYSYGFGSPRIFPEKLETIYPWKNFFEGSMENYLKGDEYIGGCFGFETRYPFCDRDLVQEFLWLKPRLKNRYKKYDLKPPLLQYLEKEKFPFAPEKLGFNV